ncbi:MAG: hypothetical protein COU32_02825 [Candidatus Magasanikbacteria bacterium CG10_big_fil_rev_8_21_14_0_10_42_10]|uniref:Uncharacterized protein n=2 Tax=Candidatus Magasanikiibacteriota TaxID=1752731 RepID=A0A2H0TVY1_9BACT|nr:MAG: hypothetical protein COU32_02825 [Candidatus Magasanikbacteria bacterium CG10_big_fil_rev_8_21_14_0_10_42_10]PIZ92858.1 MAG: hypothetical protein COX82_03865 [Candidatus Magasanikbacteria bacterium CG_4_10_14_0_2_um_filter_41_10]
MFGKEKKEDILKRYEDPISGFSSQDLKRGIWYVQHRDQIKKIGIACFILFDVLFFGYGFWGWTSYLLIDYTHDRENDVALVAGFQNYALQHVRYEATPLQFGTPTVYKSGDQKYDLVIDVDNPNKRWVARVRYQFSFNGGMTEEKELIIMPGAHQLLPILGVDASTLPSGIRFQPLSIDWRSIDPHLVYDVADYIGKRNQFIVNDVTFTSAGDADISGDRVTFTVTNASVFNYWSPQFFAELKDGPKREGVVLITLDQSNAGDVIPVDIRLFGGNMFVTDVTLYPLFNFFDQQEFMN